MHDDFIKIGVLEKIVDGVFFCDSNKFRWNKTKQMYEKKLHQNFWQRYEFLIEVQISKTEHLNLCEEKAFLFVLVGSDST
jgi:hypothetical protein